MAFPEYIHHDAVGLAQLVRERQVSSHELLDAARERIEATNPQLNAVIHRLYDRASQALAAGLPRGPFTGVPFLLKDTLELAGTAATFGSVAAKGHICDDSHELACRHEASGLVIVGRTNMSEIGLLPTSEPRLYGATKNPWRRSHSAGGSSGGSAAAVAARMVPLAHADDGGGSIRIPASACGLFGLKPSRGRNPGGDRDAPLGFIQTHCVSRSVRDSATLLDVTQGSKPGDAYWAPAPPMPYRKAANQDPTAPLRIAFMTQDFSGTPAHTDCAEAVRKAAALCEELGHQVEEAAPVIDGAAYNDAFLVVWGMCAGYFVKAVAHAATERAVPRALRPWLSESRAARTLTALPGRLAPFEPFTRRLARIDAKHSPADLWQASEKLSVAGRSLSQFLTKHDLLLTPVMGKPPWLLGTFSHRWSDQKIKEQLLAYVGYTQLCNTAGVPAMSVPLHWSSSGLPIGVQFIAPFAQEHRLFSLAGQLERAEPWSGKIPQGL